MSSTGNTGNSTSTTANTNNNTSNNNTTGNKVTTPIAQTQPTADLSANKTVDQVQKDQPNKPDSTTPVTPEAGTSKDEKKSLLESAIAIEAQKRVQAAFIELGEANTTLREIQGQHVQDIRAYQELRAQEELESTTATEPVTPHSGAGRSSPQLDGVSAALETIISNLAENTRTQPPAFGTPSEGTEPSPDTIFRLYQLFEQPFAEINTATDSDPQVTALLHEFRQRWATALFNEYLVRQNKVAMQRTLEEISRSDIPRPHLRLLKTAARTIHTSGNQLDSLPHTQLGIRSGRSTQDEETGRHLRRDARPNRVHQLDTERTATRDSGSNPNHSANGPSGLQRPLHKPVRSETDRTAKCFVCRKMGHRMDQCWHYTCTICKRNAPGHYVKYCDHNPARQEPPPSYAKVLADRKRIAGRRPQLPNRTLATGITAPGLVAATITRPFTVPPPQQDNTIANAATNAARRAKPKRHTIIRVGLTTLDNVAGPRLVQQPVNKSPSLRYIPYPNQSSTGSTRGVKKPHHGRPRPGDDNYEYSDGDCDYPYDDVALSNMCGEPVGQF